MPYIEKILTHIERRGKFCTHLISPHSFHSLEAEKEHISFTFEHTNTGMIETKSPPGTHIRIRNGNPNLNSYIASCVAAMRLAMPNPVCQ